MTLWDKLNPPNVHSIFVEKNGEEIRLIDKRWSSKPDEILFTFDLTTNRSTVKYEAYITPVKIKKDDKVVTMYTIITCPWRAYGDRRKRKWDMLEYKSWFPVAQTYENCKKIGTITERDKWL